MYLLSSVHEIVYYTYVVKVARCSKVDELHIIRKIDNVRTHEGGLEEGQCGDRLCE